MANPPPEPQRRGNEPCAYRDNLIADFSRMILLGIAVDASRVVAREVFRSLSSVLRLDYRDNAEEEDETKGGLAYATRTNMCSTHRSQFWTRRAGLLLWSLLPPPLMFFGIWSYSTGKNEGRAVISLFTSGVYISSIFTSLGLILWMSSNTNDAGEKTSDDSCNSKGNTRDSRLSVKINLENDNQVKKVSQFQPPENPGKPVILMNFRDEERRPRSDSMRSTISENSVITPTIGAPTEIKTQKKYLEILVHNVSHTDMILGLSGEKGGTDESSFIAEYEITPRRTTINAKNEDGNRTVKSKSEEQKKEKYILARPRFSAFDMFSRRVLMELRKNQMAGSATDFSIHNLTQQRIISYPRYERSSATARYTLVTPRPEDQFMLPVGFNLERSDDCRKEDAEDQMLVDHTEMPSLRLRGRDVPKVDPSILGETPVKTRSTIWSSKPNAVHTSPFNEPCASPQSTKEFLEGKLRINAVFFPLLSSLLARWLGQIADKYGGEKARYTSEISAPIQNPNVKKVFVLVSGVGTPRNWTHSMKGNSTECCAELMEIFIKVLYPDITVVRIHSDTNILRYDENITFATQELMPCIDSYRDANARGEPYPDEKRIDSTTATRDSLERNEYNPDWRKFVSVTYSFADGSSARTHAIQAALRPYRPTYFHFWQLKTFWHESKITDEDIEVHSFEEMETVPAIAVDQTSDHVLMVVNEMKAFRKDFISTLEKGRSDLKSFWLRKSKKPVLAVLLVHKPGTGLVFYRGTNMEVSMPTGSLCAERNAIGTALASDPGMKREDLIMVAVLAVPMPDVLTQPISPPPGPLICQPASMDEHVFAKEVEEKLKYHHNRQDFRKIASSSSFASISENKRETDDWEMEPIGSGPGSSVEAPELNFSRIERADSFHDIDAGGNSTPRRRVALYESSDSQKSQKRIGKRMKKRNTTWVPLSIEDINPLKPCGSCNEWLKKIAESNPHFKVLTFTDTQCNGVYISPCQE
mmetsp:Transcript_21870/g.45984  ORF Transcript_21870/g.45984 Transcript_21870/m.45984 type:complete len:985 (-) Transcript_21870:97-3051(-)